MGIVFMAGGCQLEKIGWEVESGSIQLSPSYENRSGGTRTIRPAAGGSYIGKVVPARADYYIKCGIFQDSVNACISFKEGTIVHATVLVTYNVDTTLATIKVYQGTTAGLLVGTYTGGPSLLVWHCIEIYCKSDNSAGMITVKLDGVERLALENLDTNNAGTSVIDSVTFGNTTATGPYYDDVVIRDDIWPGVGSVYALVPIGVGANAGFTASAGNPFQCVDEIPPTYTDYISKDASVLNTKHDFALTQLTGTYIAIRAVAVLARAKLDASGTGGVRATAISGATTVNGTAQALTVTDQLLPQIYMAVNPAAGTPVWDKTSINALLAGVETQ